MGLSDSCVRENSYNYCTVHANSSINCSLASPAVKWEEFRTDLWISGRITFLFALTEVSKPKHNQEDGLERHNVGCRGGSRILLRREVVAAFDFAKFQKKII